jgi:hypothetical protein
MDAAAPDDGVVVDVVFEDGVRYLELANLADRPALNVGCSFDPPLVDAQGRDVSELRLFRYVEFLGPGETGAHAAGLRPRLLRTQGGHPIRCRRRMRAAGGAAPRDEGNARPRALPRAGVPHLNQASESSGSPRRRIRLARRRSVSSFSSSSAGDSREDQARPAPLARHRRVESPPDQANERHRAHRVGLRR